MIDPYLLRDNLDALKAGIAAKRVEIDVDRMAALDGRRRELIQTTDALNKERNDKSKEIGPKIKAGEDASALKKEVQALKEKIKEAEAEQAATNEELNGLLLSVPNLPHESVPPGKGEDDNKIGETWGEPAAFDFEPKPHWEIGESLGILDLAAGVKLAGSGFYVLRGLGAKLERALISWMIDVHTAEHGYTEIMPPHLASSAAMTGTGQFPKMVEDSYRIEGDDLWLIPTAEVPVTNIYREEILDPGSLPIRNCAFTPCFRREAGSYGKEVRGITRVHQFNKVEMVQIVEPETSYDVLESLRGHAETILQRLGLHYRVLELCTGDLSFAAAKCYDLEVWAPGMNLWLEVSSCSNFEDFQARRASIRYRSEKGAKPKFPHTLNGSGLALPRTVIALLETYQQPDGTVAVPEVLQPYLGASVIQ